MPARCDTLLCMDITQMDWVRAALANAMAEDMTLQDVWACAEHAATPEAFDDAVNELAQMMPGGAKVFFLSIDDLDELFGE